MAAGAILLEPGELPDHILVWAFATIFLQSWMHRALPNQKGLILRED